MGLVSAGTLATGCHPDSPELMTPAVEETVSPTVLDGTHGAGNPHFFLLPPLTDQPSTHGVFDPSLLPHVAVEICLLSPTGCAGSSLATFTADSGSGSEALRVPEGEEHYIVNWHMADFDVEVGATYRIRVLVAGTELGHADIVVVQGGGAARKWTGEEIALQKSGAVPIRFRIEEGAVFLMGPAGGILDLPEKGVRLRVPEGALADTVGITVLSPGAFPEDPTLVGGSPVELGPETRRFRLSAQLTVRYAADRISPGVSEQDLRLHRVGEGAWVEVFAGRPNPDSDIVTGAIGGLGTYGVLRRRPVARVAVRPDSVSLAVGSDTEMTATPLDEFGNHLARSTSWTSSRERTAIVDEMGVVSAKASGVSTVTAVSAEGSGTATVVVVDPRFPFQPEGFGALTDQPWNALASLDWKHENRQSESVIAEDPTAPASPPNVLEHRYPEGFPAGQEPAVDFFFVNGRTFYLSVHFLASPNWTNHRSFVNKLFFLWLRTNDPFQIHFFPHPTGGWTFRSAATTALFLDPNLARVPTFELGEWVHLEWLVEHTGGTTWRVRWWVDGVPAGDHRDVPMPDDDFAEFQVAPTWGGGATFKPQAEYLRFDHLYFSQREG